MNTAEINGPNISPKSPNKEIPPKILKNKSSGCIEVRPDIMIGLMILSTELIISMPIPIIKKPLKKEPPIIMINPAGI